MSERDLPSSLHAWLTQEMRFTPPPGKVIPSSDDIRGICRGPMVDVWKFILEHVYSVQTVKTVKGNLALHDRKQHRSYRGKGGNSAQSEEEDVLCQRQTKYTREVTQCQADIRHLEKDIERLQREIADTERSYRAGCEDMRNCQRRAALLRVYSKQMKEKVAQYQEFHKRLENKFHALVKRAIGGAGSYKSSEGERGLESVSHRQVRETCDSIGTFLQETLQGSFAGDRQYFSDRKQSLWSQVETTLSDLPVTNLVDSLVNNTQTSASTLREKTMAINIRKDAENLRFKFEEVGQLRDMSVSTPLLMSVHHRLEESQLSHIQAFMRTEQHLNAAAHTQQDMKEETKRLNKLLASVFTDKPGEMQLAQRVIEGERGVVSSRAALHCLLDTKDRLQEDIEDARKIREKMYLAYKKIHDFQEIADSKQNLIRVLSKQNLNARSRLDAQQLEIMQYIQRSLTSHLVEVKATCSGLDGCIVKEMEKFSSLMLPYLLHVYLDGTSKVGLLSLSIHQATHPSNTAVRQALINTLDTLNFPPYKGPECTLQHCMDLMGELQLATQLTKSLEMADKRAKQTSGTSGMDVLEDITELRGSVTEQDRKLVERVLPVLNKRLAQAGNGLANCLSAQASLKDWWEQPAQSCAPWVKVDNESYKDWLDKWKVIVTRLVQIQVQK